MNYSKRLIQESERKTEQNIANVCFIMIGFMILVAILEVCNIFVLPKIPVLITVAITITICLLPTLFYKVLKIYNEWVRYFIITALVIQTGLQYAVLSYHVILMICFPTIIACLYGKRKYLVYSCILTVPMIIISHVIAVNLKVVPDEPLQDYQEVFFYGIVPRVIEYGAIFVCCLFINNFIEHLSGNLIKKNNELYEDQDTTISSLSALIESRSNFTGGHVKRVADFTAIILRGLGFEEEEVFKISRASMMHDVGKLLIPTDILDKPAKLTKEEFDEIKKHVTYGEEILGNAEGELFKISSEIAYQHHEWYNGNGYLHLKGEEISLYARIVAVSDVFDALCSKRPYKEAWSVEKAYQTILDESGTHFDPKIVDVFIENFEEFKKVLEKYKD